MQEKWNLESRTCICGCGQRFRTLPHSPSHYWSVRHMPNYRDPTVCPRKRALIFKALRKAYGDFVGPFDEVNATE